MELLTAYRFTREELKHLDVFPPSAYDSTKFGNEPWLEALVYLSYKNNNRELLHCLDGNSTTCGDSSGANILILRKDFEGWISAAEAIGAKLVESKMPLAGRRFGDEFSHIDLAQSADKFYWIDELLSPAAASAKVATATKSTD